MKNITILGAGTWGIALARMLQNSGHTVTVWSALPEEIDLLSKTHEHPNLKGVALQGGIRYTKDIQAACTDGDVIVFAVPSPFIRATARTAAPFIGASSSVVCVAKGLEKETHFTMCEILEQELKQPAVALSGPTHAEEVAKDHPTMIVAACSDRQKAAEVQSIFSCPTFRVYTNSDVRGVELCGAIKNIVALAAGISDGLGYGDNAKAALITRGIAEMYRLGHAMGCHLPTFAGLAGIGDLVVTATSVHSRNNRCGRLIGSGKPTEAAVKEVGMVVEGLNALDGALSLAEKYKVEMPIVSAVYQITRNGADPAKIVTELMERSLKEEFPDK